MAEPWKISLHGGHSGEFCEHAQTTLREMLEAAVAAGYSVFGVSEHAPRSQERFIYPSERKKDFDVERLRTNFEAYAESVFKLADEFESRLTVLRGFEAEVVPTATYRDEMVALRKLYGFDYMVGSVHYVAEISIDGSPEEYEQAAQAAGGYEAVARRYYDDVAGMIEALRPEVVGHLDLVKLYAPDRAVLEAPSVRQAAERALAAAKEYGAILDLNTAGYRKGLGEPYPAPWLVRHATEMGVGFCFGDDSHSPAQVGSGLDLAREYLRANNVREITALDREGGEIVRRRVPI